MIKDTGKPLPRIIDTSKTYSKVGVEIVAQNLDGTPVSEQELLDMLMAKKAIQQEKTLKKIETNDQLLRKCKTYYSNAFKYLAYSSLHVGFWLTLAILNAMAILAAGTTLLLVGASMPTMFWFYMKSSREYLLAKNMLLKLEKYEQ